VLITVGDPRIDWTRLAPQADSKTIVLIEDGIERVVGTTTEQIELLEVDDRLALQRTQAAWSDILGDRLSTTVVLRSTFGPISHHDQHAGATVSLGYRGLEVSGTRQTPQGSVEPLQFRLERPAFDAHSVEMILRLLPLSQGYSSRLPAFHAGLAQILEITVAVTGREEVRAGGGRQVPAWIVETELGRSHAVVTYWIGGQPAELLKQSSILPSGDVLQFVRS
jgi:hypothetical protein